MHAASQHERKRVCGPPEATPEGPERLLRGAEKGADEATPEGSKVTKLREAGPRPPPTEQKFKTEPDKVSADRTKVQNRATWGFRETPRRVRVAQSPKVTKESHGHPAAVTKG